MKVLFDTNLLIRRFRKPDLANTLDMAITRSLVYMSSVVALELRAGCRTRSEVRLLESFLRPFDDAGRLVTPDNADFLVAGRVLALLGESPGLSAAHRRALSHDVLIAVSAAKRGIAVLTADMNDFGMIAQYVPLRWFASVSDYLGTAKPPAI